MEDSHIQVIEDEFKEIEDNNAWTQIYQVR